MDVFVVIFYPHLFRGKEHRRSPIGEVEEAHEKLISNGGLILEANGGEGCCGCIIDVVVQVGAFWFPLVGEALHRVMECVWVCV